ncbi:MAG: flagellar hook-associated protein FlgK [Janthinobacterium lividum]
MIGLNGALSIASQALSAQYAGLSVANNNIANVNTPGYSRQIVTLSAAALAQDGGSVSAGVTYGGYTSVRNNILDMAINDKTSDQASLQAQSSALTGVNTDFSDTTSGIGASMSTLFSNLSALSTNPTNAASRQTVLSATNGLVNAFHQASASLTGAGSAANQQVVSTVAQINQLTTQIASINGQLSHVDNGSDGGALQDQRDSLTNQLAGLTGVAQITTDTTPTLTTTGGSPLVIGSTASKLQVMTGADGTAHVLDASGADITTSLSGGTLGGVLTVRDKTLPTMIGYLSSLATQFAGALNAAQASGTDMNGNQGAALLSIPAGSTNAAASLKVAMTDPNGIALSSNGSTGSSGNLANLLAVQTNALPSGATPSSAYSSLVYSVGAAGAQASNDLTATSASLTQLTAQRSTESGVSIDEETTNLIRFQQGYQAAARVISTLSSCYTTLMNIGSN